MMIVSLFMYQKIRIFPLGHDRIFPVYISFMNIFLTHQYSLGPKIAMKVLLFPTIFYTHRIFILFLFLEPPSLWTQRNFIITLLFIITS